MCRELRTIVGLSFWWAEGTKSRRDKRWKNAVTYPVEITNTDPIIIKVFLDMLRRDFNVDDDRIRVQIQIHEGDRQEELEEEWSRVTKISRSHFNKTIVRPKGNKPGKSNGTCKVRFADKKTYLKLKESLDLIFEELTDDLPKEEAKLLENAIT